MKFKYVLGILLIASISVFADITAVTIPAGMLHEPNANVGLSGFSGKVEYKLNSLDYDSVFVTLSIVTKDSPEVQLPLSEVTGDVGLVHIVKANAEETHQIFFQVAAPQNVQYKARVSASYATSSVKTEIDNFLNIMGKDVKASLCTGTSTGDGFEGSGGGPIPEIFMADGPNGVRPQTITLATLYPTCSAVACTWDTALAYVQGQSMAEEFMALGKNCVLGPAMNLVYHPQLGRASEYYSEDPYLSGRMGAADVRGIQSKGIMATIKHFACNNKEDNRRYLSANLSERSLRELYLYNWKTCVVDAGCIGVMGAYNMVNHSYANSNKYLMTKVLRDEWGYKSLVMTDWGARFDDFASGIQWGADIEMPSSNTYNPGTIAAQPDSIVNMHARRIIYAHEMIGDLKTGYNPVAYTSTFKSAAHDSVTRHVGSASIVLAKNDTMAASATGKVLPLPKSGAKIAITGGSFATQALGGPGGSSQVTPFYSIPPNQGISKLLFAIGAGASTVVTDINTADYIVVFVGVTGETENSDRPSLTVDGDAAVQAALQVKTAKTVVVYTGGSAASAGNWSKADAILIAFYPGAEQGRCIADVLFGNVNPSGKLPVTFPVDATQLPNFDLIGGVDMNYPPSDEAHGYFRVNKKGQTPLFNFGHGLSYTTFEYSDLQIFPGNPNDQQPPVQAGDRVHIRVTVKNTGTVTGKEVVQLYLSMPSTNAALPVRVQDLRGFKKVALEPGASTQVDFILTAEEMQVYNPNGADYNGAGAWQILPGEYGVRVGTSSQLDLPPTLSLKGKFTVQ